jgi:NUDIX domain.
LRFVASTPSRKKQNLRKRSPLLPTTLSQSSHWLNPDDGVTASSSQPGSNLAPTKWIKMGDIARIESPWISLIAERLKDPERDNVMDYWRIERADSAIIIVVQGNKLIFPKHQFRPGIGRLTLDFPGGRIKNGQKPIEAVKGILEKELGVTESDFDENGIVKLTDENGLYVDSSVSSQKLHGFVVTLNIDAKIDKNKIYSRDYMLDNANDMDVLLKKDLLCLQCRSLLMEWMFLSE